MKKILLLKIILLYSVFTARAQEKIVYDFKDKTTPILDELQMKPGNYYQLVIKNINLNLYKVSLTASDTVLSKALETPTLGSLELDAVTKAISGIGSLNTSLTKELVDTENLRQDFNKALNQISLKTKIDNPEIISKMDIAKTDLESYKKRLEEIGSLIDNLKLSIYKTRLEAMKPSGKVGNFNYDKALQDLEDIRSKIATLKKEVAKSESTYNQLSEENKTEIAAETKLSNADKSIKETYGKFNTTLTEAQNAIDAEKSHELLASILFLEQNSQNEYKSFPFQFKGDQSKLKLVITPRDEKYLLQTYTTQIFFPLQRKQYTVVGVSFYGSTLHDKAYSSIKTVGSDSASTYSFIEEDATKAEAGVTALIRFGTKINSAYNVGVHGSLGPGITLTSDKIRPRILMGGGFSFGKTHMAAVDFGAITGSVNRLSSSVQVGDTYPEKPESVTVSRLDVGFFFSLGYVYKF